MSTWALPCTKTGHIYECTQGCYLFQARTYIEFAQIEGVVCEGPRVTPPPKNNSPDLGRYFWEWPFQKREISLQRGRVVSRLASGAALVRPGRPAHCRGARRLLTWAIACSKGLYGLQRGLFTLKLGLGLLQGPIGF